MPADLLSLLGHRVVVLDGGMGTSIHSRDPKPADWGGEHLVNLSDAISLTHPEWIIDIHRQFLEAGSDAVETNTFNACRHVLAEFGMGDRCFEINRLGATLARAAVAEFATPQRPRFVI